MKSVGIKTHIWNNNLLSLAMLFVLPIALLLWFCGLYIAWQSFIAVVFPIGIGRLLFNGIDGFFLVIFDVFTSSFWVVFHQLPIILVVTLAWYGFAFIYNVKIIQKVTGARGVARKDEPEIYNILENLAISRGMVMPRLSIIESTALNAFASGIDVNSYHVTVTRGLISHLTHDELEAVIAHEFTHIENHDTRLMMIIMIFAGVLDTVLGFTKSALGDRSHDMGRLFSSKPRAIDARLGVLMGGIFLITRISSFITNFVKLFISRKREFMADAGAVELTHHSDALVRALVKIENNAIIPEVSTSLSGIFIMPVAKQGRYRSHPTLENRVKALRDFAGSIVTKQDLTDMRETYKEIPAFNTPKKEKPVTSWKDALNKDKSQRVKSWRSYLTERKGKKETRKKSKIFGNKTA